MPANPEFQQAIAAFQRGDLDRARLLAEELLAESPDPQLQHLLGLIECRSGRVDSGIEWLDRACRAEPENIPFRVMLARALVDGGRAAEALQVAVPPPGESPPELALWHVRAEAADACQDWEASAEAWAKLCSAGVADRRAWRGYASALAALAQWARASQAFRRAAELDPQDPALRRSLAIAFARAGNYDESADELRRWVEMVPGDVESRIMLARMLADLGRHEDAMEQMDRAAELATGAPASLESGKTLVRMAVAQPAGDSVAGDRLDAKIVRELAHFLERTNRMDALRELLDEAEARGVKREEVGYPAAAAALRDGDAAEAKRLLLKESPDSDPTRWHWLMARIADAAGDSATAFAEAERMNRSANDYEAWRLRAAQHIEWGRRLASTITLEWAAGLRPLGPADRRSPVFLVGFPRSGTTLLDTFLMGHPDTSVLEEQPMMRRVETALGDILGVADRTGPELEAARNEYFAELDRHADPPFRGLVIDKSPLNMMAMPYVHALFPDAPIIFAQRHPCDAVLSCFMQRFALNNAMACFLDLGDSAALYDVAMTVWTQSQKAMPLNVHTLAYEKLVADPEAELRPLIDFLGLDWNAGLLDHRATAEARGVIATPSYDQVTRPLSQAASGRWKRYAEQLEPVLPVLLPWADRLGYRD